MGGWEGGSEGGWAGGRKDGMREEGGMDRARGGREEAMMLGSRRASVEEGRLRKGGLMKGTSEEGTGRGMDGGREEASEGGIERGKKGARGQARETSREVSSGGHGPVFSIFIPHPTTRPLPLILCYYK